MADPFDALGIEAAFDVDLPAAERRYRDISRVLHPDRHAGASPSERRLSLGKAIETNDAWQIVRDPIRRAEALLRRHGIEVERGRQPSSDPAFLMDLMEQREALSEARRARDRDRIGQVASRARASRAATLEKLARGFAAAGGDGSHLRDLVPLLGELRYQQRFLEEVDAAEEELDEPRVALAEAAPDR